MTSLQHHERLFEFVNDSVMTRTIDGIINFWNHSAEKLYGWRKEEAIGRISHDLLQTQFPKPLEEIESELVRNGRWEGKLVHATRDGDRVLVESRWTFDHTGQPGTVVEVNTRTTDREIEPEAGTGKKHYIRELIFPGIATVGLLLLLAHKSEFPVVANRYSFNYTILLSLFAVNLAFLWHRIVLRLFHQEEIKPLLTRALLCLVIFFIAVGFLLDFSIASVISVREWVVFMLLGGVVAQAMAWRGYDIFIPHSLLAIVCSTALT